jgi:hypothetical protein
VTLPWYIQGVDADTDRIEYLAQLLPEDQFKKKLYVRSEKQKRRTEEQQMLTSYVTIGEELFRELHEMKQVPDMMEQFNRLSGLRKLTDEALTSLDKKYRYAGLVRGGKQFLH